MSAEPTFAQDVARLLKPYLKKGADLSAVERIIDDVFQAEQCARLVHEGQTPLAWLEERKVLVEVLKMAQAWLANSLPVVELEGPEPLPVIAAALKKAGVK